MVWCIPPGKLSLGSRRVSGEPIDNLPHRMCHRRPALGYINHMDSGAGDRIRTRSVLDHPAIVVLFSIPLFHFLT